MSKFVKNITTDADQLFDVSADASKLVKRLAIVTAILAVIPICGFISFSVETYFYGILAINLIFLLSKRVNRVNGAFIFFYLVLVANVTLLDIPPFFKPAQRAVLFMLVTFTTASVISSPTAIQFRRYLFKYTLIFITLLSVGSFFCYFLGINLMSVRYIILRMDTFESYSNHGGWFGGLVSHSMILGPISMIATVFFYVLYIQTTRKIYLAFFLCTLMSTLFASSRSAILGLAIAILYSLIFGKFSGKMKRRMFGLFLICGLLSMPFSDIAFKGVMNKHKSRTRKTEQINSRQEKFDYRIAEFKSSPLLGVGFCSVDINGGDGYSPTDGRIEPGTSHLSVLSQTGALGMLAYLIILYQAFNNSRKSRSPHARFALLCCIAFFVHAWFEGYILSAGGFLAFMYWLVVGQCIDCKTHNYGAIRLNNNRSISI